MKTESKQANLGAGDQGQRRVQKVKMEKTKKTKK